MKNITYPKHIVLFFIFSLFFIDSFAQKNNNVQNETLFKEITKFIAKGNNAEALKDSAALYALNFKITIIRNKNNEIKVRQIVANDSLAYKFLPDYMKFTSMDYTSIMKAKQQIILIIPILVFNGSSKNTKYKKDNGEPLIDLMTAVNSAYALSNTMPFNNLKQAEEDINHRIYKFNYRNNNDSKKFDEIILMKPNVIQILNIK